MEITTVVPREQIVEWVRSLDDEQFAQFFKEVVLGGPADVVYKVTRFENGEYLSAICNARDWTQRYVQGKRVEAKSSSFFFCFDTLSNAQEFVKYNPRGGKIIWKCRGEGVTRLEYRAPNWIQDDEDSEAITDFWEKRGAYMGFKTPEGTVGVRALTLLEIVG